MTKISTKSKLYNVQAANEPCCTNDTNNSQCQLEFSDDCNDIYMPKDSAYTHAPLDGFRQFLAHWSAVCDEASTPSTEDMHLARQALKITNGW